MISKRVLLIVALLAFAGSVAIADTTVDVKEYFYVDHLNLYSNGTLNLYDAANPTGTATSSVFGIVMTDVTGDSGTVAPPIGPLTAAIKIAYNNGPWTGVAGAITSTTATTFPTKYALAPLTAADWTSKGFTVFHGVDLTDPLKANYGLVQMDYAGDCSLDGKVDNSDINAWKASMITIGGGGTVAAKWLAGDVNYDGSINNADLNVIKGQLLAQGTLGASFPTFYFGNGATAAAVPEPSTIVLLVCALAAMVGYRKFSK